MDAVSRDLHIISILCSMLQQIKLLVPHNVDTFQATREGQLSSGMAEYYCFVGIHTSVGMMMVLAIKITSNKPRTGSSMRLSIDDIY